jgi:hypothetical protein
MDLQLLIAERGRVAHEFRLTVGHIAMLRAHLTREDLAVQTRRDLLLVIEGEAAQSRQLSERLLQLDVSILKMEEALALPAKPSSAFSALLNYSSAATGP